MSLWWYKLGTDLCYFSGKQVASFVHACKAMNQFFMISMSYHAYLSVVQWCKGVWACCISNQNPNLASMALLLMTLQGPRAKSQRYIGPQVDGALEAKHSLEQLIDYSKVRRMALMSRLNWGHVDQTTSPLQQSADSSVVGKFRVPLLNTVHPPPVLPMPSSIWLDIVSRSQHLQHCVILLMGQDAFGKYRQMKFSFYLLSFT